MGIIDLFKNSKKADSGGSVDKMENDIESKEYAEEYSDQQQRFKPDVDYSSFDNFVFYGSAEKYYEDALDRIARTYPYDGSRAEKVQWRNDSTPFDLYVLDEEYPQTTGFVSFTSFSSSQTGSYQSRTYKSASNPSIIEIDGHVGLGDYEGGNIADGFKDSNVYDPDKNRTTNLRYNLPEGNTVEFWFRTGSSSPNNVSVLFDLWNNKNTGSKFYGRYTVEADESNSTFLLTFESGSKSVKHLELSSSAIDFSSWNQYSIRSTSTSGSITSSLYVNGVREDTSHHNFSSFGEVTGALQAHVSSFITAPSGSNTLGKGWGSLSASLDEFRYWKNYKSERHIKRHWFTNIHGGVNTDEANTDLGLYYKFNEGITKTASIDSTVLDYSGRVSNGNWVNYSNHGLRKTGSAFDSSSFNIGTEDKDPIIYKSHPDVKSLRDTKINEGQIYDDQNTNLLYDSFPDWMIEEDSHNGELRKLTQILSSYLDNLHLQIQEVNNIKNKYYNKNSGDPLPFADRLLEQKGVVAPDIFPNATVLESLGKRTENEEFEDSLQDIKNSIYHNIYNNIQKILKTKGTEESFRNLIRCFGIDRDVVDLKLYGDELDIDLDEKHFEDSAKSEYIDFHDVDEFDATVYQDNNPNESTSKSFIEYGSESEFQPFTLEGDVIFPDKPKVNEENYFKTPFQTASLFGFHKIDPNNQQTIQWASRDDANLQVLVERNDDQDEDAVFRLTSTGSVSFTDVTSSLIKDVYTDSRWIIGATMYPEDEAAGIVSGTSDSDYVLRFEGYRSDGGESFAKERVISSSVGQDLATGSRRVFAGSHREDYTGSVLQKSDAKIGSIRYWADRLEKDVLKEHAKDPTSIGSDNVSDYPFHNRGNWGDANIPGTELLALQWEFDDTTGSDSGGEFRITDFASGSSDFENKYDFFGKTTNAKHTGIGKFFLTSSTITDKNFLYAERKQWPEYRNSSDDVEVNRFQSPDVPKNPEIKKYTAAAEKSLYDSISDDILTWFGTIDEFNNLIGDPVEKHRPDYKRLTKLRELFFSKIGNEPDVNRFVDYYRWFDDAISAFIEQLMPGSAGVHTDVQNTIESHVLERNKYRHPYPTMEFDQPIPEGAAAGVNELFFNKDTGHYSASDGSEWRHEDVWSALNDGNPSNDRKGIVGAITASLRRTLDKPYHLLATESPSITGSSITPHTVNNLQIASGSAGNFLKRYEYFNTNGRRENPKYFVDNPDEFDGRFPEVHTLSGSRDEKLPDRSSTSYETIIANRFAAPGSSESMARGYLDPVSEEYSVYNQVNYRNLGPRDTLNSESKKVYQFDKVDLTKTSSVDDSSTPEFHKTPRNRRIVSASDEKLSSSPNSAGYLFYDTASFQADNYFIQHAIPRTTLGYKWVDDSYDRYDSGSDPSIAYSSFDLGYEYATGSDEIPFVSASDVLYD